LQIRQPMAARQKEPDPALIRWRHGEGVAQSLLRINRFPR
jgi:hypothetical protein